MNSVTNRQIRNPELHYKTPDELNQITEELISKDNLEDALLTIFYTGTYVHPCRLQEVFALKIRNYEKDKDNYEDLENNCLILNSYKTSQYYGKQTVEIPECMINLILEVMPIEDGTVGLLSSRMGRRHFCDPLIANS